MTGQNLLASLAVDSIGEKITTLDIEATELARTKKEFQQDKLAVLKAIGAFRSYNARLVNYDKSKSDDLEKAIIQARRQNIRAAEKLYIGRQEKALGRESGTQSKAMSEEHHE
ncbi:MAG: hypothetical protein LBU53_10275 [Zoogloeaceae bacterium]|jgi:hypothetical protein|nr:hypothetical protein [Zoogloeaceae bacterium]